jgi:hypothetical protein
MRLPAIVKHCGRSGVEGQAAAQSYINLPLIVIIVGLTGDKYV